MNRNQLLVATASVFSVVALLVFVRPGPSTGANDAGEQGMYPGQGLAIDCPVLLPSADDDDAGNSAMRVYRISGRAPDASVAGLTTGMCTSSAYRFCGFDWGDAGTATFAQQTPAIQACILARRADCETNGDPSAYRILVDQCSAPFANASPGLSQINFGSSKLAYACRKPDAGTCREWLPGADANSLIPTGYISPPERHPAGAGCVYLSGVVPGEMVTGSLADQAIADGRCVTRPCLHAHVPLECPGFSR